MQAIDELVNQLIEETQEFPDEVPNFILELLQDTADYSDVKADFSENQTILNKNIMHEMELKDKQLKEKQEWTDKLVEIEEMEKDLGHILKALESLRKVKMHRTEDEVLIKINEFYNCPECPYKTKRGRSQLKNHINVVHLKLKLFKCSDCTKGKRIKTFYFNNFINNTFKF